jgi:SPW repeat
MTPTNEVKDVQMVKGVSTIVLLAGIWFFVSPWIYHVQGMANAWNSWIVGALMVILAAIRIGNPLTTVALSWVNCVLGVWAFISPWVYRYTPDHGRLVNSLCVGAIVFIAAIVSATRAHHPNPPMVTHS